MRRHRSVSSSESTLAAVTLVAGVLDSAPPSTVAILTPSSRQVRRLHARRRSALLHQWMSHAPRTREREGRRVAVHARSDQLAASDGGPPGRPAMDRAERRDAYGWHSGSSRSAWRAERRRYRRRRAMSLVYTCHRGPTTRHPVRGFTPAPALMVATT